MDWRNSTEYRIWRVGVIRRDSTCQCCGTLQNRHAHHINHATYFPEQRFDVENGITLCDTCHSHFHNDFKRSTREKCDVFDLGEYMKLATYFKEKGKINEIGL